MRVTLLQAGFVRSVLTQDLAISCTCSTMRASSSMLMRAGGSSGRVSSTSNGSSSRRAVLLSSAVLLLADKVQAKERMQGAAELDLRYYLKDLFSGNVLDPSMTSPEPVAAARDLDPQFVQALQTLTLKLLAEFADDATPAETQQAYTSYVTRVEPSFQRRAAFPSSELANQRNFDMRSYAAFKTAGNLIASSTKRSALVKAIGDDTYYALLARIARTRLDEVPAVYDASRATAEFGRVFRGLQLLLEQCKLSGLIRDFKLDRGEYEEGDWDGDATVSFQTTIYDPATLNAFLQASSEGSRLHADYTACALAAYLRACHIRARYEEYPLDSVYRPNPNEFVATEVVVQWTLEPFS